MAKQVLPVNFQDDVLNTSMGGKRRYRLLQQSDGTYILEDVTTYDTIGSTFGAAQINQTNQAVNQSTDKDDVLVSMEEIEANIDENKIAGANTVKQLNSDLGGLSFGQDAEGNWGYIPSGADAVIPFSSYVIGEAIWGNHYDNTEYTYVNLGFRPKKLIGYTCDPNKTDTLAVEAIHYNIFDNDDIVHRQAVSRYYNYVMGDAPGRIVITDTGFTMYNDGDLWRWCPFRYVAFRA